MPLENLIILAIIWAIFRTLANKARGRRPTPVPEEEQTSYKLPPDLRGKWGPPQPEPIDNLDMNPYEDANYPDPTPRIEAPPAVTQVRTTQERTPSEKIVKEKSPGGKRINSQDCFDYHEMSPGMLRQGIILSEILAPPISKRKRDRCQ